MKSQMKGRERTMTEILLKPQKRHILEQGEFR